jgi:hypothetical protein
VWHACAVKLHECALYNVESYYIIEGKNNLIWRCNGARSWGWPFAKFVSVVIFTSKVNLFKYWVLARVSLLDVSFSIPTGKGGKYMLNLKWVNKIPHSISYIPKNHKIWSIFHNRLVNLVICIMKDEKNH